QKKHGARFRGFVDKDAVFERFWSWRAGLGWLGKNTMLIHRKLGSYIFLGGLFTDLELTPDEPYRDHCGKCTKCIEACPTQAFVKPHVLDSNKCIAYHTIENRGPIPQEVMERSSTWIAGCDICQQVCPWNDPIPETAHFKKENQAFDASFMDLAQWTRQDFKERMRGVAMSRMKYAGFLRNFTVAISNSSLEAPFKQKLFSRIEQHMQGLSNEQGLKAVQSALEWAKSR
ncbi:MAG: tRNA epoxyqueuosine(34) reductase QueG, partial [Bdellovibrionota bacterium]